jgi:VanZ family protein
MKIIYFFEKRPWLVWVLTFAYMATIFYISSLSYIPEGPIMRDLPALIKHAMLYTGLGILLFISFKSIKVKKYAWILAVSIAVWYGITDEIHQAFVPGRVCALEDVIANGIGSVFGASIVGFLRKNFKGKKP